MSPPLVSVIMAARNHGPYVREAMESVLGQGYSSVELVVIDDASADNTAAVVAAVAAEHPESVRLVRHDFQAGIASSRSEALRLIRGEYVGLLDSDDLWLPGKLERQVPVLDEHPDVGLVYGDYEAFDSETGDAIPWGDQREEAADPLRELFRRGCYVMTGTVLMRRAALARRQLDFWNPGYPSYDDYLLYLALALDWRFVRVPATVMRYRRHASNLTATLFAGNVPYERFRLLKHFELRFPDAVGRAGPKRRAWLAAHLMDAAAFERRHGTRGRAAEMVARALAVHPPTALAGVVRAGREAVAS